MPEGLLSDESSIIEPPAYTPLDGQGSNGGGKVQFSQGESAASRYEKVAAGFDPANDLDAHTEAVLRFAAGTILARYRAHDVLVATSEAAEAWRYEVTRLVIDGYLLGRIEDRTEGQPQSFDSLDLIVEFLGIVMQAIAKGLAKGSFSGPPPAEVDQLLDSFGQQAITALVRYARKGRLAGEALGRAIRIGREIALVEGFYFVPSKRFNLFLMRKSLSEREKSSMQDFVDSLADRLPIDATQLVLDVGRVMWPGR